MIYAIPVVGWFIGFGLHVCLAIPFYFLWWWLAGKFFYWLPPVYLTLGFWEIVGLFATVSILKFVLVPRFGFPSFDGKKKEGE